MRHHAPVNACATSLLIADDAILASSPRLHDWNGTGGDYQIVERFLYLYGRPRPSAGIRFVGGEGDGRWWMMH